MRIVTALALVAIVLLPAVPADAQEEAPEARKYENVTWYEIAQIDFKPGKRDAAIEIIENHYMPAAAEAGTPGPVMTLQHRTGEWDLTVVWHMKRGPAEMEWERTPEGIAWYEKFAEMAGGPEEARKIGEEFSSYIARETVSIALEDEAMGGE